MNSFEFKHMVLGPSDCPVFHRWRAKLFGYGFALHHFIRGTDPELQHDHAWWFVTLVLKGSYLDVGPSGTQRMTPGKMAFRSALHRHSVVDAEGCWTLVINGRKRRDERAWFGSSAVTFEDVKAIESVACE